MFQDLDATLRAMLDDANAPVAIRDAEVSFDTPDRDFKPTQSTVNFFLHDVSENRLLRVGERVLERNGDTYSSRLPPLRVDCTYLTTAWSVQSAGLKTREEHLLLGQALAWLSRFPLIEDRWLQGSLKDPPQPFSVPTAVAQVKEGHGMGEFWTALGIAPRPAFSLTVTISMQLSDQVDEYLAAEVIRVEIGSLQHPALSGRVLDHTLAPVLQASVTLVEDGQEAQQATVGPTGAFAFAGLGFGRYTLQVRVPNLAEPIEEPVEFAARRQVHNVIIPGL